MAPISLGGRKSQYSHPTSPSLPPVFQPLASLLFLEEASHICTFTLCTCSAHDLECASSRPVRGLFPHLLWQGLPWPPYIIPSHHSLSLYLQYSPGAHTVSTSVFPSLNQLHGDRIFVCSVHCYIPNAQTSAWHVVRSIKIYGINK